MPAKLEEPLDAYRLWIKEGEVAKLEKHVDFALAYRLKGPLEEREACDKELRPAPALTAMARLLAEVVSELPHGSHLTVIADYDALVGAFDARDYFGGWRSSHFKARPAWAALDALLQARRIAVSSSLGKAAEPEDRDILQSLGKLIDLHWPRLQPKPRKKNYKERGPDDDAFRRALEKREDFPQRDAAKDRANEADEDDGFSGNGPSL